MATLETWIEFLAPGLSPAPGVAGIWGSESGDRISVSVPQINQFNKKRFSR